MNRPIKIKNPIKRTPRPQMILNLSRIQARSRSQTQKRVKQRKRVNLTLQKVTRRIQTQSLILNPIQTRTQTRLIPIQTRAQSQIQFRSRTLAQTRNPMTRKRSLPQRTQRSARLMPNPHHQRRNLKPTAMRIRPMTMALRHYGWVNSVGMSTTTG